MPTLAAPTQPPDARVILLEDPAGILPRRFSILSAAEFATSYADFERAVLEDGGTVQIDDRLHTDAFAFIDLARAAQDDRVAQDLATGDSPLRRRLRALHQRRQLQGGT